MKVLLKAAGVFFICIPVFLYSLAVYYSSQDILVHDVYFGIGDFSLDLKGITVWSLCIGIFLLFMGFKNTKVEA